MCVWLLLNQTRSKLNAEMPRFAGENFLSQDSHLRTQKDKFQNHPLLGGEVLVIFRGQRERGFRCGDRRSVSKKVR